MQLSLFYFLVGTFRKLLNHVVPQLSYLHDGNITIETL